MFSPPDGFSQADRTPMTISILILTLNEEQNLAACLEAVRWSDDVVVLDSFSSDGTTEIAKSLGIPA